MIDIEAIERRARQPVNGVWPSAGACRTDIRALLEEVATLRAALTAAEGARDMLEELTALVFGREAGDEPDVYTIGYDELGVLARRCRLAARRPAATQAKEIADDHAG